MNSFKNQLNLFFVMFLVAIFFNPMNILAYQFNHLYLSYTLIYTSLFMASNMIWSHQIVHYLNHNIFDKKIFCIGIFMSLFIAFVLLRNQFIVSPNQWLKRMIPHHSTALTTTNKLINSGQIKKETQLYRLAKDIIFNQEREILLMKSYL